MPSRNASVVLVHGAWADGSSWAKIIAPLTAERRQGGRRAFAADVVPRRRRGARPNARAGERAGRTGGPCLCRRCHWGDAQRQGEGARLCGRARPGRRRDGRGRVLSRQAASAGAQARAGRARADLSARGGLRRRLRAKCFRGGAGGAGGGPAADLARLHHRQGGAAAVEGPAGLVPGGRAGPDDRRRKSALHGRADEGSAPVASCRSRARW